ncbi:hypothetical protein Y032_0471g2053 [Ancylostoma ceylanicum]|uniref:Uncharacterized protein n=1 Tax=Ancylostoma ceylanicum TaxID=53326 RepID=A0A016WY07_9BILA|nr:hypothetical protein Y032_0471g2053 [Ancylostoma ceylanicum]
MAKIRFPKFKDRGSPHSVFELLTYFEPTRCADSGNFAGANLHAKTCFTVDLIDRTGQYVFTRRCCCGGQTTQLGVSPVPTPRNGYFDPIKGWVFGTSVTFPVHFWNQRGDKVKDLLMSSTKNEVGPCF